MREAGPRGELPHAPDVAGGKLLDPGVGAQRPDLPADVDHGLVERVAERLRGIAAHQDGPGLGHEPAHVPDVPGDRDRAALERDPGPGGRVALDHDQPAARRGTRALGGVAPYPDRSGHQVLPHRPAHEAVDDDVRAVAEPADEVPGVAGDRDVEPGGQADGEVVPAPRLRDANRRSVRELAQRLVQLAHREPGAAELGRRQSCHV
jgi:hypothetical protein